MRISPASFIGLLVAFPLAVGSFVGCGGTGIEPPKQPAPMPQSESQVTASTISHSPAETDSDTASGPAKQ